VRETKETDHQQLAAPWRSFEACSIYHSHLKVCQLFAVAGSQIVTSTLHQQELRLELSLELLEGFHVRGDVLANGGVTGEAGEMELA
jgi:hypothetical protein